MISLSQFGSVKSFTSNRTAHCKNCFERRPMPPGEKRITLSTGLGMNARTLYLCVECARFQAERLEQLASDLRRAVAGWVDTEAEWYANRDQHLSEVAS